MLKTSNAIEPEPSKEVMSQPTPNFRSTLRALLALTITGLTACGGSQQPAESPEAVPSTAPSPAPEGESSGAPEGEHTMPDGTKMKGHEHGDGSGEHQH
jgi:hypothetical protein